MVSQDSGPAVDWLAWTPEAFARAAAAGRPILLFLGTASSPGCDEMQRTTFADAAVVALVRARFVPVRVDADERPDVNERYNLGGWPTTAFLTPGGDILGGGTFVEPARLAAALAEVADTYRARRPEIDARAADERRRAIPFPWRPRRSTRGWTASCSVRSTPRAAASGACPGFRTPTPCGWRSSAGRRRATGASSTLRRCSTARPTPRDGREGVAPWGRNRRDKLKFLTRLVHPRSR